MAKFPDKPELYVSLFCILTTFVTVPVFAAEKKASPNAAAEESNNSTSSNSTSNNDHSNKDSNKDSNKANNNNNNNNNNAELPLLKSAREKRLKKDFAGALVDVNQAIEKSPNNEKALLERARLYLAQKKFTEAIADCTKSIELKENPRALNVRSAAKIDMKDFDGAIKDSNRSLEIAPGTIEAAAALCFRGRAKQMQDHEKEAIDDFNASLKINPKFANAYGFKAHSELKLLQYDKAEIDCNKALELNPKFTQAYLDRCYIRILAKNFKAGLEDANSAITSNPKMPLPYEYRGKMKASLGDNDGAIIDIDKAIELGGDSEELNSVKKVLAEAIKADAGQFREAAKETPHVDERMKLTPAQTLEANNYVMETQNYVKGFWKPEEKDASHPQASIRFMIDSDGRIFNIQTHTSSGDSKYDQSAVAAVAKAGTVKKPPTYLSTPVLIEMDFKLVAVD
jgi:TonB family protein